MKFVILCLVFVVAAFGAVGLAAQGRPHFSGTWIGLGLSGPDGKPLLAKAVWGC